MPGLVEGVYLHGSLVLEAFTSGWSEGDFVAATSRPCTPTDLAVPRVLHRTLASHHPTVKLEGSDLPWQDFGRADEALRPHPHVRDGRFDPAARHTTNPGTGWLRKQQGMARFGPAPNHLPFEADWLAVRLNIWRNDNA